MRTLPDIVRWERRDILDPDQDEDLFHLRDAPHLPQISWVARRGGSCIIVAQT
jgi:hypothetical protein